MTINTRQELNDVYRPILAPNLTPEQLYDFAVETMPKVRLAIATGLSRSYISNVNFAKSDREPHIMSHLYEWYQSLTDLNGQTDAMEVGYTVSDVQELLKANRADWETMDSILARMHRRDTEVLREQRRLAPKKKAVEEVAEQPVVDNPNMSLMNQFTKQLKK